MKRAAIILVCVLVCGCAAPVARKPVVSVPLPLVSTTRADAHAIVLPPKPITLAWNCGHKVEMYEFLILPKTSGIESTQDFTNWFREADYPVSAVGQEMRHTFMPSAAFGFYRAVDRY